MTQLSYRPDIDGLRAVAVTSVVLFHAFPETLLPGGFTGVDVFFVISGYLITRIIAGELAEGQFSIWRFYERRIKRIIPALFVMMLAALVAGWFLLLAGDYKAMAESALYAALSISNIYFFDHTGYFDGEAQSMPLLHTWSLGVEEQFYLVWPALLMGAFWLARRYGVSVNAMVAVLAAVTLGYSVWLAGEDPKAAFFLAPSRAYELLAGALLALGIVPRAWTARPAVAHIASIAGAALIGYGFLTITQEHDFPGWYGLIPTLGAALVILGGAQTPGAVNRLLGQQPLVFLGKISYSLYLWHWPVLVFFAHYAGDKPSPWEATGLIALSIALATLSYVFVEQPARRSRASLKSHYQWFAGAVAVVAALTLAVTKTDGALARAPQDARGLASLQVMWKWKCTEQRAFSALGKKKQCMLGAPWEDAPRRAVLWGDSNAEHYAPLLERIGRERNIAFLLYRSCPAFIDGKSVQRREHHQKDYSERCGEERERMLAWLAEEPGLTIVLASAWEGLPGNLDDGVADEISDEAGRALMARGLAETLAAIEPKRHPVVLLGQFPIALAQKIACAHRKLSGLLIRSCDDFKSMPAAEALAELAPTEQMLKRLARSDGVRYVATAENLCQGGAACPLEVNGEFIYRDRRHIRRNLSDATEAELIERIGLARAFD